MPMHFGNDYVQGETGGEQSHTLILNEIPTHNHLAVGVTANANSSAASANTWAAASLNPYIATPNTQMSSAVLGNTGGSQPHDNMPPYLTLNFIIALVGIFPSRN
jgi:microcystin-dependent protein